MKIYWISFNDKAISENKWESAKHLHQHHCGRMDRAAACFYQHGSLRGAIGTKNNSGACSKCHPVLDPQLVDKDQSDTEDADHNRDYLSFGYALVWKKYPGENESNNRDHRLQDCSETGCNILFAPKYRAVIDCELQEAGQR